MPDMKIWFVTGAGRGILVFAIPLKFRNNMLDLPL